MSSETITEDAFHCGICFELLIDPTTLTCGHSICRSCLAQWWFKSKKATCPECRQVWQGFPKVNVTLRNTIETLFPGQIKERRGILKENVDSKAAIKKFEEHGKAVSPTLRNHLNWTLICTVVAVSIALAVIIGVGTKKIYGLTQRDLMSKALRDWSPDEVGLWIGTLGPWAKGTFDERFVQSGIDGTLLLQMTDVDLKNPPINMSMQLHRRVLLYALKELKNNLSHHSSGFWEYKEVKSGMAMFIMFGLREFPRATLAYLYLFNYWDTFVPIFYCTVTIEGNHTTSDLMEMKHNPTLSNWLEFIPRYLFVPYYLVGRFASHFLEINYWTSRVVIMHAVLMTLTEFTKAKFVLTGRIRKLPYMAMKYFTYVVFLSLCCKLLWPFVPFFIADCVFYWMLYVSPFDALNRLRRRFTQQEQAVGHIEIDNDTHHRHNHNHPHQHNAHEGGGWHFNFDWNAQWNGQ